MCMELNASDDFLFYFAMRWLLGCFTSFKCRWACFWTLLVALCTISGVPYVLYGQLQSFVSGLAGAVF